jgi:hypothetical protein
MRMLLWAMTPLFFATGCVSVTQTSGDALCGGTRAARAAHAAALADSPDDRAVVTGTRLIELIDAGCRR